MIQTIIMNI